MSTRIPSEPHRAVLLTAVGTTVLIAVGAFILSFAALTDLAERSGIEGHLAWIWPIIVDGMIVAATVAIVALNGHNRRAMVYPWTLLFFGASVSTAANSVHAILTVGNLRSGVPALVSALVAAMPPVVLLAITHLTVHMYQKRADAAEANEELYPLDLASYPHAEAVSVQPQIASADLQAAEQAPEVVRSVSPQKSSKKRAPSDAPSPLYEETVQALNNDRPAAGDARLIGTAAG